MGSSHAECDMKDALDEEPHFEVTSRMQLGRACVRRSLVQCGGFRLNVRMAARLANKLSQTANCLQGSKSLLHETDSDRETWQFVW